MAELLKTSLVNLHSCLKLQDSSRGGKATDIAKDIFGFSLDVSPQEVGKNYLITFISSQVFNAGKNSATFN